jgi:serine/threonine-protein kinase
MPYLVMEYVRGVDLESYRARRAGALAVDEALGILDQLCSGVGAIHAARAVHRDLKHSNVLIGPAFRVAVTDLGVTRGLDDARGSACVAGTPGFMAPELLQNRDLPAELAPRSDVYSLGVIAYELLTGETLFDEPELAMLIDRHCRAEPPRPSDVRPDLPLAFDAVILKALAKDPRQRTSSALELRRELVEARATVRESYPTTRVLIVDDDPAWRGYLTQQVHESLPGAQITAADDGQEALSRVASEVPSIAIVDLKMPRLNGFELIAALRGQVDTRATEVVVVTAHGGGRDWELLRGLGVTGFFVKPFEPTALSAVLRRVAASHAAPRRSWKPMMASRRDG